MKRERDRRDRDTPEGHGMHRDQPARQTVIQKLHTETRTHREGYEQKRACIFSLSTYVRKEDNGKKKKI